MTQESYNMICKILSSGAPALANELINDLNNLIASHQKLIKREDEVANKKEEE